MIRNSFCFLPRIGVQREKQLWKCGISDWNTFLETKQVSGVSSRAKVMCDALLSLAKQKLWEEDASFFARALKQQDQWRLYDHFKDQAVYLDIETNGYYNTITVVGLYDGSQTKTFVLGINLDRELLARELTRYKMIVTFNGASFDLPVIKRYFNLSFNLPHVDLRFVCQHAGFTGGLKSIERELGIRRASSVDGLSGSDAIGLWHLFVQTKKREYLDQLVAYNEEDVINLPILAQKVIPQLWEGMRKG